MGRYSKYKTKYVVDPRHELQACAYINSLGNRYILEGASDIGSGDLRIWYKDCVNGQFYCKIVPIVVNFDAGYYPPKRIEITPDIEKEEDLAADDTFLIDKK